MEKKYAVNMPVGNLVTPSEPMSEKELRTFVGQIQQDADVAEVWREKAEKDPIEEVIQWLVTAGYTVNEV